MKRLGAHQIDLATFVDGEVFVVVAGKLVGLTVGSGLTVDITDPANPILKTVRPIPVVLNAADPIPSGLDNNTPIYRRT